MYFELSDEMHMLKDMVRKFVDRELIPIEMHSIENGDIKPEIRADLEAKTKDLGLWLLDVPTEYGGAGMGLLGKTLVWEEIARTVAIPLRGPGIFGPEIRETLYQISDSQKEKYLYPLLRGEKRTAFAQTEPDAGSDPGMMRTTAARQGDYYVINGAKRFITHAGNADFIQLVAATDRGKGTRGGLSMFLVDMEMPGVKVARKTRKMMGDITYELHFDDVRVPVENLVGGEGDGMRLAQSWITRGRILQAARGIGVAQRCLELAVQYADDRSTFGAKLRDRQAVQFMLADIFMQHQLGQAFVHRAAWRSENGKLTRHESYIAKIFCTELGFHAADRCMQIHGGMGLSTEMPIAQMWKDARSFLITEGPVEVMRMVLARDVFRLFG